MAIAVTPNPNPPKSLGTNTASFTGLAATTAYVITIVGPQGTSTYGVTSDGSGNASVLWAADGAGTYTFYTALGQDASLAPVAGAGLGWPAPTAVPSGAFTVSAIN